MDKLFNRYFPNDINNLYTIIFFAVSEVLTGLILGYISNLIFQAVIFE